MDTTNKMVDKSCDTQLIAQMKEIISAEAGVLNIDDIRTRLFGAKIYVDIEISADGNLSLNEAHTIAERVHDSSALITPNSYILISNSYYYLKQAYYIKIIRLGL